MKFDSLLNMPSYDPDRLLDKVIEHMRLKNDAALSRALQIAPPVISKTRRRRLPVGGAMLLALHDLTEVSIRELRAWMGDTRPSFH